MRIITANLLLKNLPMAVIETLCHKEFQKNVMLLNIKFCQVVISLR